jgi:transcriptional regulator with XRE-family HTH domain
MNINYTLIGQLIRLYRKEKKLTQEQLAEISNLSTNHISHIEIGSSPLSLPALVSICDALGITSDQLLFGNMKQENPVLEHAEIEKCFHGVTTEERHVMIAVAAAARDSLRNRRNT